ncbi:uncharacterized protein LOC142326721 [Lycorma delicatula]|uniref:uncharacterized protein LOC142326721 n=1 Tax=Lycorma delicatula TaxID=130591 RepID=UPI003F51A265
MEVDLITSVTDKPDDKLSKRQSLCCEMLDHLCKSKEAHFKSQQIGEPELLDSEKRVIAESVLNHNKGTFLARFGSFLLEEHLDYFTDCSEEERYEVDFYLKTLHAAHNKSIGKVKVRNRRFEALKKLVSEGSYFSEYEMKKRNPLLYEQLVGRFLTEEEEKERTGIDTTNITFVNLLLEQYDRDQMKKLKKRQEEDEDNVSVEEEEEEEETDNESDEDQMNVDSYEEESDIDDDDCDGHKKQIKSKISGNSKNKKKQIDCMDEDSNDFYEKDINKTLWGEEMTEKSQPRSFPSPSNNTNKNKINGIEEVVKKHKDKKKDSEGVEECELSEEERNLLMEEFRSSMFNSFLEGKDADFDYSEVDQNSEYDDLDMRDQDEQDKYFNSDSPDIFSVNSNPDSVENIQMSDNETVSAKSNTGSGVAFSSDLILVNDVKENEDSIIDNYIKQLQSHDADSITDKMENLHQ